MARKRTPRGAKTDVDAPVPEDIRGVLGPALEAYAAFRRGVGSGIITGRDELDAELMARADALAAQLEAEGEGSTAKGGRPPRAIVARLQVLAGFWIAGNGLPARGERAELERFLAEEAGEQLGKTRIAEIAEAACAICDAHLEAAPRRKTGI
jgi:hypothetical protein